MEPYLRTTVCDTPYLLRRRETPSTPQSSPFASSSPGVSGKGPMTFPTPSFHESTAIVHKSNHDGLLQVGTTDLMITAAVLLAGPCSTTKGNSVYNWLGHAGATGWRSALLFWMPLAGAEGQVRQKDESTNYSRDHGPWCNIDGWCKCGPQAACRPLEPKVMLAIRPNNKQISKDSPL